MVTYDFCKGTKLDCESLFPPTNIYINNLLLNKTMNVRRQDIKTDHDYSSGSLLQCSLTQHDNPHIGCRSEYKYQGSSNMCCPNHNGNLNVPADLHSYHCSDIHSIHRAATFPTFSPLAPTYTKINPTPTDSLKASDVF